MTLAYNTGLGNFYQIAIQQPQAPTLADIQMRKLRKIKS